MTQTVSRVTQVLEYPLQHFLICLHSHQQADNAVAASCFTLQLAKHTLNLTLSFRPAYADKKLKAANQTSSGLNETGKDHFQRSFHRSPYGLYHYRRPHFNQ